MKKVLIIGATSAIAIACSRLWAKDGAELFLVGRSVDKIQQLADDLTIRGGVVHSYIVDLNQYEQHPIMLDSCFSVLDKVDIVLIAHGTLSDQKACECSVDLTLQELSTNGVSVISMLTLLANRMEIQGEGIIAVISSVAGDRGRLPNYVYGSAKAAVSIFCEGLRARLFKSGVHVLTIKPGFVDTPMTKGLMLPNLLLVSPERVALSIYAAISSNKNIAYIPWFWFGIMSIIKIIPAVIFKRLGF